MGATPRYRSTVEDYKAVGGKYEREPLPYDMADPFDLAAWIATLVYRETDGTACHEDEAAHEEWPSAWELEQDLRDLASNAKAVLGDPAAERLTSREAITTAFAVLVAMFPANGSAEEDASDSRPGVGPEVPADLWHASSDWLGHFEETEPRVSPAVGYHGEAPEAEVPEAETPEQDGGSGGEVADTPEPADGVEELKRALLANPLATVLYMARLAFGQTVTQSEAARRLGVSPARVNVLVFRGRLSHLRVGRAVLLLQEEVGLGLADRRRRSN